MTTRNILKEVCNQLDVRHVDLTPASYDDYLGIQIREVGIQ